MLCGAVWSPMLSEIFTVAVCSSLSLRSSLGFDLAGSKSETLARHLLGTSVRNLLLLHLGAPIACPHRLRVHLASIESGHLLLSIPEWSANSQ